MTYWITEAPRYYLLYRSSSSLSRVRYYLLYLSSSSHSRLRYYLLYLRYYLMPLSRVRYYLLYLRHYLYLLYLSSSSHSRVRSVFVGPGNGSPSATNVVLGVLVVIRFSKY